MSGVATQVNISLESVLTAGQVLTVLELLLGLYIITPGLAEPVLKMFFRARFRRSHIRNIRTEPSNNMILYYQKLLLINNMPKNISITVNDINREFLDSQTSNRSAYINKLIEQERKRYFTASMEAGYKAQSIDPDIQEDDQLWEIAVGDGVE
jgi:hypothetical protein